MLTRKVSVEDLEEEGVEECLVALPAVAAVAFVGHESIAGAKTIGDILAGVNGAGFVGVVAVIGDSDCRRVLAGGECGDEDGHENGKAEGDGGAALDFSDFVHEVLF